MPWPSRLSAVFTPPSSTSSTTKLNARQQRQVVAHHPGGAAVAEQLQHSRLRHLLGQHAVQRRVVGDQAEVDPVALVAGARVRDAVQSTVTGRRSSVAQLPSGGHPHGRGDPRRAAPGRSGCGCAASRSSARRSYPPGRSTASPAPRAPPGPRRRARCPPRPGARVSPAAPGPHRRRPAPRRHHRARWLTPIRSTRARTASPRRARRRSSTVARQPCARQAVGTGERELALAQEAAFEACRHLQPLGRRPPARAAHRHAVRSELLHAHAGDVELHVGREVARGVVQLVEQLLLHRARVHQAAGVRRLGDHHVPPRATLRRSGSRGRPGRARP